MAPSCPNLCHKGLKCSGLGRSAQLRPWECPTHSPTPPPTPAAPPHCPPPCSTNHDPLPRGLCDACGKIIRKGATRLGCATPLCSNQCHSGEKCSGVNRYRAQPWHCHLHSTATPSGPAQPVTRRTGPTTNSQAASPITQTQDVSPHPSVTTQTQTQDISPPTSVTQPQDPTRDKQKCALCHRPIRRDTLPALCSTCNCPFHKKCTALQRADADTVV